MVAFFERDKSPRVVVQVQVTQFLLEVESEIWRGALHSTQAQAGTTNLCETCLV